MHSQEKRELHSAFRREEIWRKLEYQMTRVKKYETRDFSESGAGWNYCIKQYNSKSRQSFDWSLSVQKSKLEQNWDLAWRRNLGWSPRISLHLGLSWAVCPSPARGHLTALPCPEPSGYLRAALKNTSGEMQEGCKTQEDGNSQTTAFIYFIFSP